MLYLPTVLACGLTLPPPMAPMAEVRVAPQALQTLSASPAQQLFPSSTTLLAASNVAVVDRAALMDDFEQEEAQRLAQIRARKDAAKRATEAKEAQEAAEAERKVQEEAAKVEARRAAAEARATQLAKYAEEKARAEELNAQKRALAAAAAPKRAVAAPAAATPQQGGVVQVNARAERIAARQAAGGEAPKLFGIGS